ncbi:hypothetical protein C8J57DRAFT_1244901 [Mycena rebaudengoi]|nr:hypothetical protein C8J57DRAFT_1244901 [Mycena rebaudengoi]
MSQRSLHSPQTSTENHPPKKLKHLRNHSVDIERGLAVHAPTWAVVISGIPTYLGPIPLSTYAVAEDLPGQQKKREAKCTRAGTRLGGKGQTGGDCISPNILHSRKSAMSAFSEEASIAEVEGRGKDVSAGASGRPRNRTSKHRVGRKRRSAAVFQLVDHLRGASYPPGARHSQSQMLQIGRHEYARKEIKAGGGRAPAKPGLTKWDGNERADRNERTDWMDR